MTKPIKPTSLFVLIYGVAGYGLLIAYLMTVLSGQVLGANPTKDEIAALRSVIEDNFRAQTEEDLPGVLATLSRQVPADMRAELAAELKDCFAETDLQLKLVSFEISSYQHPDRKGPAATAVAEVVQLTTKRAYSYSDLGEYPSELSTYYRHNSAMLPQTELVKYAVKFIHDGRAGWKAYKIISRVKPVQRWPGHVEQVMSPDYKPVAGCVTGNCRIVEKR